MRFFQVQQPKHPRGCWAASWGNVWHILTTCWVESERTNCKNYARTCYLTCYQHRWRENAAWEEAERLAKQREERA